MERISQLARENPDRKMQTIMHMVNKDTLREAHESQERGKASGVDRVTKDAYGENLEANLDNLITRMKQFSYRPQPVRRVYIPKDGSGKLRPLGIPAYEDKLVQGAMADVLVAIYEEKFYNFSYGFRPNRNCHQALKALSRELWNKTYWVVDADIKGFFDNVDHEWMMKFLEHDIEDPNFLRYVKRFLKAGIMEEGQYHNAESGVPQGGSISAVLANVYLHYALDMWFYKVIRRRSGGKAEMVRYADDVVFCFEYEEEARAFYEALKERLRKFNLELSEEKSKIIEFGIKAKGSTGKFDFLGFTHLIGKSRKGEPSVKRITSQKKLKAKKQKAKQWLRDNMHAPIKTLVDKLNIKLKGHYNYYGIIGNYKALNNFLEYVKDRLIAMLERRGAHRSMKKELFSHILKQYPLLRPRITQQV
jgi:group II intron reverse transcriptase/maturase